MRVARAGVEPGHGSDFDLATLAGCRVVYLSPHLDDLALSSGGLVRRVSGVVAGFTVVNVFTRSAWAPAAPGGLGAGEISALRSSEDDEYCRAVGVERVELGLEDASLRGYSAVTELAGDPGRDPLRQRAIARVQAAVAALSCDWLFSPAAIGNHVDHRLVFEAAATLVVPRLAYYEDLPYACRCAAAEVSEIARARGLGLPRVIDVASAVADKLAGMRRYRSQVEPGLLDAIVEHARRVSPPGGGERIWLCTRDAARRARDAGSASPARERKDGRTWE